MKSKEFGGLIGGEQVINTSVSDSNHYVTIVATTSHGRVLITGLNNGVWDEWRDLTPKTKDK